MSRLRNALFLFIALGSFARFYDLDSPWRRKDHYNYGGVHTQKMVECFDRIPLNVSKAIPMFDCQNESQPIFYPNHPPTLILGQWAWSKLVGLSEASIRSFVLLFSLLNILMVYLLAKSLNLKDPIPPLAAAVQSVLPGPLYFGTHSDFVCEFSIFWCLVAALFLFRKRVHLASLFTILAGVCSWLGYLGFAGLLLHQWINKRKIWPVIFWGFIGVAVGLSMMMWLQQTPDLRVFLIKKLTNPHYAPSEHKNWTYPLRWLYTALQYQNILVSPFFLLTLILSAWDLWHHAEKKRLFLALFVVSAAGWVDLLPGHEYFYIHGFDYMHMIPAYSILIAWGLCRMMEGSMVLPKSNRIWFLAFVLLVTYSYGRLKTNIYLDVLNSVMMIGVTLRLAYLLASQKWHSKQLALIGMAGLVNISQMINWRNEPKTDFDFCNQARIEFQANGNPVTALVDKHFTRDFYCRGIELNETLPIVE